jgi:hypothetical protein
MYKIAEYEALRATIRQRGTVRIGLILAGVISWGALTLALNAGPFERAATLVPLLVLAATFEVSFFIHTAVERVGRYLQVFYENQDGWETVVMAYGRNNAGGLDPLFVMLFAVVAIANFACSLPAQQQHPGWVGISLVAHVVFGWRLARGRRLAGAQRAQDLQRFLAIKNQPTSS